MNILFVLSVFLFSKALHWMHTKSFSYLGQWPTPPVEKVRWQQEGF